MLVLVTVCMFTERGRWKMWHRIAAIPAAWIGQALLQVPALVAVGRRPDIAERMVSLAASLPVVIFAMRQSRLFVTRHANPAQESRDT